MSNENKFEIRREGTKLCLGPKPTSIKNINSMLKAEFKKLELKARIESYACFRFTDYKKALESLIYTIQWVIDNQCTLVLARDTIKSKLSQMPIGSDEDHYGKIIKMNAVHIKAALTIKDHGKLTRKLRRLLCTIKDSYELINHKGMN